jgi:hypothetical protein
VTREKEEEEEEKKKKHFFRSARAPRVSDAADALPCVLLVVPVQGGRARRRRFTLS